LSRRFPRLRRVRILPAKAIQGRLLEAGGAPGPQRRRGRIDVARPLGCRRELLRGRFARQTAGVAPARRGGSRVGPRDARQGSSSPRPDHRADTEHIRAGQPLFASGPADFQGSRPASQASPRGGAHPVVLRSPARWRQKAARGMWARRDFLFFLGFYGLFFLFLLPRGGAVLPQIISARSRVRSANEEARPLDYAKAERGLEARKTAPANRRPSEHEEIIPCTVTGARGRQAAREFRLARAEKRQTGAGRRA